MLNTDELLNRFETRRRLQADLAAGEEIARRQRIWTDEEAIRALKSLDLFERSRAESVLTA